MLCVRYSNYRPIPCSLSPFAHAPPLPFFKEELGRLCGALLTFRFARNERQEEFKEAARGYGKAPYFLLCWLCPAEGFFCCPDTLRLQLLLNRFPVATVVRDGCFFPCVRSVTLKTPIYSLPCHLVYSLACDTDGDYVIILLWGLRHICSADAHLLCYTGVRPILQMLH